MAAAYKIKEQFVSRSICNGARSALIAPLEQQQKRDMIFIKLACVEWGDFLASNDLLLLEIFDDFTDINILLGKALI